MVSCGQELRKLFLNTRHAPLLRAWLCQLAFQLAFVRVHDVPAWQTQVAVLICVPLSTVGSRKCGFPVVFELEIGFSPKREPQCRVDRTVSRHHSRSCNPCSSTFNSCAKVFHCWNPMVFASVSSIPGSHWRKLVATNSQSTAK